MALAFDRRRINGPETTFPIFFDTDRPSPAKRRRDEDRAPHDVRPIFLQLGLVAQADGSAYIETDRVKMACAVYGPRPARNQAFSSDAKLNVQVRYAPFADRDRRHTPNKDVESPALASQIAQALLPAIRLDLLPKSSIDVFVSILEADGEHASAATAATAASAALAHAGVEMRGLVVGCTAALLDADTDADQPSTPTIYLDPTTSESRLARATLSLFTASALGAITNVVQSGPMSADETERMMDACASSAADIHRVIAGALVRAYEERKAGA